MLLAIRRASSSVSTLAIWASFGFSLFLLRRVREGPNSDFNSSEIFNDFIILYWVTLKGHFPSTLQTGSTHQPSVKEASSKMQLILIGGAQRSGTTLLQVLLANALDSPVLPEAHILSDILAAFKRAKEFGKKTRFFYPMEDDLLSSFQSFARRHIADVVASARPVSTLVLKDPHFVELLDEASALFLQPIRVVCIRNPLDIAASFVKIGQREPKGGKPTKYQRRDIDFICKKILASYLPLMDPTQTPNAILARYEFLASEPREALQVLARDTGLALSLDRIDKPVWLEADVRHQASWVTELEGQKPSPASIGSFKRVLSAQEVAIVKNICGPIMKRFGYASEVPSPRSRHWLTVKGWAFQRLGFSNCFPERG
jgi:protein-tyrosine sulfotransferase